MFRIPTLILASTRLTTLITQDEITAPLRASLQARADSDPLSLAASYKIPYLLSCNRCVSVYAAAAILTLDSFRLTRPVTRLLALSQVAITLLDALDRFSTPSHTPDLELDLDLTLPVPGEPFPAHTRV